MSGETWAEVAFFPADTYLIVWHAEKDGWVVNIKDEFGDFS